MSMAESVKMAKMAWLNNRQYQWRISSGNVSRRRNGEISAAWRNGGIIKNQ